MLPENCSDPFSAQYGVDVRRWTVIGKMECLSERFIAHMRRTLDGRVPLIATVAKRGERFIAEVKRRKDCEVLTLTRANRDAMPKQLLAWLEPRKH